MLLILTQPALLITDVVIMGAEWTKNTFPQLQASSTFSILFNRLEALAQSRCFLALLWALPLPSLEKEKLRSPLAESTGGGRPAEAPFLCLWKLLPLRLLWWRPFVYTNHSEITHFLEKVSKVIITELEPSSQSYDLCLAKTTSITYSHELHPVILKNHIPPGNSLEELMG